MTTEAQRSESPELLPSEELARYAAELLALAHGKLHAIRPTRVHTVAAEGRPEGTTAYDYMLRRAGQHLPAVSIQMIYPAAEGDMGAGGLLQPGPDTSPIGMRIEWRKGFNSDMTTETQVSAGELGEEPRIYHRDDYLAIGDFPDSKHIDTETAYRRALIDVQAIIDDNMTRRPDNE